MEPVNCPICRSDRATLSQGVVEDYEYGVQPARHFSFYRCSRCGSEFMHPRPTEAEVISFYPDTYHAYHDDHGLVASMLVNMRARARARYYSRLVPNGHGRLFDVGAGDCRHFDALRERTTLEFSGVELKPEMVQKARSRGYEIVEGIFETMDIVGHEGRYDIVSMNHLLEHVIDPPLVARKAFELLRPGGTLIGQLPCNDSWERSVFGRTWAGYHFPRHLQAFSRRGLAGLHAEAGFEYVRILPALHLQSGISAQNTLIDRGWKPRMQFGKSPFYSLFLLGVAPFELLAFATRRTGVVDFEARKPA